MPTKQEIAERNALLVAALRSGKYTQGFHTLKRIFPSETEVGKDDTKHCCLGVACEIFLQENENSEYYWQAPKRYQGWRYDAGEFVPNSPTTIRNIPFVSPIDGAREGMPPVEVHEWFGWDPKNGPDLKRRSAAMWNDDFRATFHEIADLFEAEFVTPNLEAPNDN